MLFLKSGKISDAAYLSSLGPRACFKIIGNQVYSMNHLLPPTHNPEVAIEANGTDLSQFIQIVIDMGDLSKRPAEQSGGADYASMDYWYTHSILIVEGTIGKEAAIGLSDNSTAVPCISFKIEKVLKGDEESEIIIAKTNQWDSFENGKATDFNTYFKEGDSYTLFLDKFNLVDNRKIWFWPGTQLELYKLTDGKVYSMNYVMTNQVAIPDLDFNGVSLDSFERKINEAANKAQ